MFTKPNLGFTQWAGRFTKWRCRRFALPRTFDQKPKNSIAMKKSIKNRSLGLRLTALFMAAHFLLAPAFAAVQPENVKDTGPSTEIKKIKIALLLDTSNSMDGLIEQAKSQLWVLVNELAKARCNNDTKPNLEIALYEYGNDRLSAAEGYIKLVTPLTNDLDKVSQDLFALRTNGGSEFCGQVIQTSLRQLDWGKSGEDLQVIFIAGNEEFSQGPIDFRAACGEAKGKNVVVNTIYCGPFDQGVREKWKQGADLASGNYMSIEQDRKTVYYDSPYDADIMKLNGQLNDTYIEYGSKGAAKKMNQVAQDHNAGSYSRANSVQRAVSKTKHIYKAEDWDLVDAQKEGKADLKKIDKKTLPKPMQAMSDAEIEKYVDAKSKERDQVKLKIEELNKKREAFVKEKQKQEAAASGDKMLDDAMIKAIRSQAKTKAMKFEE